MSSVANGRHQSVTDGWAGGTHKGPNLAFKSAQVGPKSAPGSQASGGARADNVAGAAAEQMSFKTLRRPHAPGFQEHQPSPTGKPSSTHSVTSIAPTASPVRLRFFSNVSGLDLAWVDGRPIDDTKFPRASSANDEPLQPLTESMFTCWKRIFGSKEVAQMKPKGVVYVIIQGDISGFPPDGKLSPTRPFWGISSHRDEAIKATHWIPDTGFMRFNSYHDGSLGLYQATNVPRDSSYQWESARPSDTAPLHSSRTRTHRRHSPLSTASSTHRDVGPHTRRTPIRATCRAEVYRWHQGTDRRRRGV